MFQIFHMENQNYQLLLILFLQTAENHIVVQKILAPKLLIYIYLHCVRSFSWCATTLDTLTKVLLYKDLNFQIFFPCGFCLKIILVGKYFLLHNYLSGQSSRKFNAAWKKENQIEQPCKSIGRLLHSYAVIEQNNAA